MDPRASLLASCRTGWRGPLDYPGLLQRLLLFDRYIIQSERLTEVPLLVEKLGVDVVSQLLNSGALAFDCGPSTFAQTGPIHGLPKLSFRFDKIQARREDDANWRETYREDVLSQIDLSGVSQYKAIGLRNAIARSYIREPASFGDCAVASLKANVSHYIGAIKRIASTTIVEKTGKKIRSFRDLRGPRLAA